VLLRLLATPGPATAGGNPIEAANRPTPVPGAVNGSLPADVLFVQGPRCSIYMQAAGSLLELLAAAQSAGVDLHPQDCYRDLAGQVSERTLWCGSGQCENAAVPGASNHGWGKAVDLQDQAGQLTWSSPGYRWLFAHASEFGFNHPSGLEEAWHWEWVGDGGTQGGSAIRPDLWPTPVRGAVAEEWQNRGGAAGLLGFPRSSERPTGDQIGRVSEFERGSIYWVPTTGAREVHGAIRDSWRAMGAEKSPLGYALTDEGPTPDDVGRFQRFQSGSVYWTPTTGAYAIQGAIGVFWAASGWETGILGYPSSAETETPDRLGRYQQFVGGWVYWSPASGAHELHAAIRDSWASLGAESGALGYPTDDVHPVAGGLRRDFQDGTLTLSAATGAVTVSTKPRREVGGK